MSKIKFYRFIIDTKIIKIVAIAVVIIFLSLLLVSYIIANISTGFNIIQNFISSLGNNVHTPVPILFRLNCILTAVLLIPINLYLSNMPPKTPYQTSPRRFRLGFEAMIFTFGGILGLFMIGIFPENYAQPHIWALHEFWSNVLFASFTFGAIWYGILITFYKSIFPKPLGVYMMFGPAPTVILRLLEFPPLTPMTYEWIMFAALLIWLTPLIIILIKHLSSSTSQDNLRN